MSSNLRLGSIDARRDPGQTYQAESSRLAPDFLEFSDNRTGSHEHGWGSLDTFTSSQNDRHGATGLSKIAQIDEIRTASGPGWTRGRLTSRLTRLNQRLTRRVKVNCHCLAEWWAEDRHGSNEL
jgi:hypothetical protein